MSSEDPKRSIKKLEQEKTWLERQYDELRERDSKRQKLMERFVSEAMAKIHFLAEKSESPLPLTDNTINHYHLSRLGRANGGEPGTVRGARFWDGLFFSVRMLGIASRQYDFEFNKINIPQYYPKIEVRDLEEQQDGSYAPSGIKESYHPSLVQYASDIHPVIFEATGMIVSEAMPPDPWSHAYSEEEIRRIRRRRGMKTIDPNW